MRRARAAAAAAFLFSGTCAAFPMCDDGELRRQAQHRLEEWRDALRKKDYARLDAHYNQLLGSAARGNISDAEVRRWFAIFESTRERDEPLIEEWARIMPRSAAAHLALAYFHAERAHAVLDKAAAPRPSPAQSAAAGEDARAALLALDNAQRLGVWLSLANAARIRVAASGATPLDSARLYREALRERPGTLEARLQYVRAASPREGGDFKRLEAIVEDARGLPEADARYIRYLVYQEMGSAMEAAKDDKAAARYYERSIPLCPGFDQAANKAVLLYERTGDHAALVKAAERLVERSRSNGWAVGMRGKGYRGQGRYREARADFERAIELGDAGALEALAGLYENGQGVPRDIARALELYGAAAIREVAGAREKAQRLRKTTGTPP